jgi:hypothetical protein
MSKARSDLTTHLDQSLQTAPVGDTTFSSRMSQDISDYMDQMDGNFNTRQGQSAFNRQKAELTDSLLTKANTGQIAIAGDAAKQNFLTMNDKNRSTLVTDPGQFQSVLASTNQALNDPSGVYANIDPKTRGELQRTSTEGLALSAVEGMARINPGLAKSSIESGNWDQYVSGQQRWQLDNITNRMLMAQEVDQNRQLALEQKQQMMAAKQSEDGYIQQLVADPTKLSAQQIATDPNLTPDMKLKWINPSSGILTVALGQKDSATLGPGFVNALQGIHAPDGTPGKITNEDQLISMLPQPGQPPSPNQLTVQGYKELRGELSSRTTQDGRAESDMKNQFLKAQQQQIVYLGGTNVKDPQGEQNYSKYMNWFIPAYQAQKDAGKASTALLTPGSPDYMGNQTENYKRSQNQTMQDVTNASKAAVAPPAPPAPTVDPATKIPPAGINPTTKPMQDKNGKLFWPDPRGIYIDSAGKPYGAQ